MGLDIEDITFAQYQNRGRNKADGDGNLLIDYTFFIVSSPMGVTPQEDYEKANEIIDILMEYGARGPDFLEPLVQ